MNRINSDFLWGGAMAANQVEGGWKLGGKGPTVTDFMTFAEKGSQRKVVIEDDENIFYPNRIAIDFYGHYKEDIKLFGELGLKALRISMQWSRVFPNGDDLEPNEEGLKFYDNVLDELEKYGIVPIVTLSHYDCPFELIKRFNGWENRTMIALFTRFCEILFERYKDRVKYWITFNEINVLTFENEHSLISGGGVLDTKNKNLIQVSYQVLHHQFVASAKVVKLGKSINPNFEFGCMIAQLTAYPNNPDPKNILLVQDFDLKSNQFCADVQIFGEYPFYIKSYFDKHSIEIHTEGEDEKILREGTVDFYALSYYNSICLGEEQGNQGNGNLVYGLKNPFLKESEWGWQIDPIGLRWSLKHLYNKYRIPLMIVENGLGAKDSLDNNEKINDVYRIDYLKQHISEMINAILEGVDLMGYMVWSPIDVVSNSTGEMDKRYGLIHVDRDNNGVGSLKRTKKTSFYWYKNMIASNGSDL